MDQLLSFFKEFDIANFLPESEAFFSSLRADMALIVLIGPLLLLVLGAWYYFLPRPQAGDALGFRGLRKIEDTKTWLHAQKLAGLGYGILGLALFVIFGVLCLFFGAMSPDTVATCGFICVIIELILTLIVWIGIQIMIQKESK